MRSPPLRMTRTVPSIGSDDVDGGAPDVDNLVRMEIAANGAEGTLTLLDAAGRRVALALPIGRLADLLSALPPHPPPEMPGDALVIRSWRLSARGPGRTRITLETPGGRVAHVYATPDGTVALSISPTIATA